MIAPAAGGRGGVQSTGGEQPDVEAEAKAEASWGGSAALPLGYE